MPRHRFFDTINGGDKMKKELKTRKPLRLKEFDYATSGAYFITICTKNRKMLFAPVGADSISAREIVIIA